RRGWKWEGSLASGHSWFCFSRRRRHTRFSRDWSSAVCSSDLTVKQYAPMRCGCLRAYCFTEAGARRSELPSRSTGFTALPLTRRSEERRGGKGARHTERTWQGERPAIKATETSVGRHNIQLKL